MKFIRPILYFTAAFVLGTGALLAGFNRMGLFQVTSVPVSIIGDTTPGGQDLKVRLEKSVAKFANKRIWEIDLGSMKQSVLGDEWVQDVLISRSLPNEIQIRVRPKTAVLAWVGGANASVSATRAGFSPITRDGALLSPLSSDVLPDVPLLRGDMFAKDEAKRKKAIEFTMMLPEKGAFSRHNVSEIAWAYEDGYTVTLIQPKVEVKLGDDKLEIKVLRVAQVLNYMTAHQLKGRVIDASFSKKVLVRLRKAP